MAKETRLILLRLDQIEERIRAKYPRVARDGHLAALLSSVRDEASDLYLIANVRGE